MSLKISTTRGDGTMAVLFVSAGADTTVREVAEFVLGADPSRNAAMSPADATLEVVARSSGAVAGGRVVDPDTDMASSGIRSGDHVEVVSAATATQADASGPVATVTVVSGADVGATFALRAGSNVIGRDPDVAVHLTDPLASKRHARIIAGDTLEIADMGSTNGVLLDDTFVTRATLLSGDRVSIGDTVLEIAVAHRSVEAIPTTPSVQFTRSPRVVPPLPDDVHELPEPPTKPQPRSFPRVALVAPVVLGLSMYLVTGRLLSLIFVAMSPIMIVGGFFDNRFNQRKQSAAKLEEFRADAAAADRRLSEAQERERQVRLAHAPSAEEVVGAVRTLGPLLWTHRTEHEAFLTVRLGLGTVPSSLELTKPSPRDAVADSWDVVDELAARFATIDRVPVTVNLRTSGGLGIVGDEDAGTALARSVMAQVAGLHSPMECVVAAFVSPTQSARWQWLEWLPHTSSPMSPIESDHVVRTRAGAQALLGGLEAIVAARTRTDIGTYVAQPRGREKSTGGDDETPTTPSVVVLVEDAAPADRRRLIRLAEKGADVNVHLIWVAPTRGALPAACRSFVEWGTDGNATVGHVRRGGSDDPVQCETLSVDVAADVARRLACVEDVGAVVDGNADVPPSVSYLELHGFEALEPGHHEQRWRRDASSTGKLFSLRALVGHAGDEPFYLDLKAQGPHALVGGTTGAGKSEFLQSWILGMAAAYSPERVTFLYVDYKGGSAFADCVKLPHSVGLVTDLTPHLVDRALASLRAELHYRERLLAAHGAKDLETLAKQGEGNAPPSLVIVIDEFAALVQEVPAFVDGVVDVAQRGRSLGLHLIMATQRPAGVIKDNLRANTNLRIALRMADEADSADILGVPTAAHMDPGLPGRAMARMGPGRLATFQSAYAGAHSVPGGNRAAIQARELAMGAGGAWELPRDARAVTADGEPDAGRVVTALSGASGLLEIPAPRRPWLDELAETYSLSDVSKSADGALAFGLVDDPSRQAQYPAVHHPDRDGNLVVFGGSGSGKSTTLRSLAIGATLARDIAPVHIYGLDAASGGLDMLRPLPNVADVVDADDDERVGRMLRRLAGIVEERTQLFSGARAADLTEYRAVSGDRGMPRILLLVDGYGTFQAEYMHDVPRQGSFNAFRDILTEGRAAGVHVALSVDRVGAMHTSIQSLVSRSIVLRMNDENQYGMLGLRTTGFTPQSPAGRAIDLATRQEMQIAVLGGVGRLNEQARQVERLAEKIPSRPEWRAEPIPRMPSVVDAAQMPPTVDGLPVLGIDSATLAPRGFGIDRSFMIAGSAGSGRSSAVAWLATAIRRAQPERPIVLLSQRRSTNTDLSAWSSAFVGPQAAERLAAEMGATLEKAAEGDDGVVVVVENVQDFGASMSDGAIVQLLKGARRNGHVVIGEADTQGWTTGQVVSDLKGTRRGLILAPEGPEVQMLFGASGPRLNRALTPPGRGFWIESGKVSVVQIPWVNGEFSPNSGESLALTSSDG